MKLYRESLSEFEAWSGGTTVWDAILEHDLVDRFEAELEELYPEGVNETTVNDLLWHESVTVCEWLGLNYCQQCGNISEDQNCCKHECEVCGEWHDTKVEAVECCFVEDVDDED